MNTKRCSLFVIISGCATFASLLLIIIMSGGEIARPAAYPNKEGFTQAIFWFEMLQSPEEVKSVLGEPADSTGIRLRHAMDTTNRYDFIFMVCYPLLFVALFLFLNRRLADTGRQLSYGRILVTAGICVSVVVLFADAYENIQLFKLTAYTDLSEIDPGIITTLKIATRIKSGAITLAGVILIYFYIMYFNKSWGLLIPLIYAVSAALGIIALTMSSQRSLIETGASIGMTGWLISTIHGGLWFFRKKT